MITRIVVAMHSVVGMGESTLASFGGAQAAAMGFVHVDAWGPLVLSSFLQPDVTRTTVIGARQTTPIKKRRRLSFMSRAG
jgi:hypothetical protein